MEGLGGSVEFISPPAWSAPQMQHINNIRDLDKSLFFMELSSGVQQDIQNDGKNNNIVVLYGVASQYNGGEEPNKYTVPLGQTLFTYQSDHTQGPQAQLQFPMDRY